MVGSSAMLCPSDQVVDELLFCVYIAAKQAQDEPIEFSKMLGEVSLVRIPPMMSNGDEVRLQVIPGTPHPSFLGLGKRSAGSVEDACDFEEDLSPSSSISRLPFNRC